MTQLLKRIARAIGWSALIIWCFLTLLVLVFLIDRWVNPGVKGISKIDLLNYANFSFWLLGFFLASRLVIGFIVSEEKKHSR
jgi:hypothetical protein